MKIILSLMICMGMLGGQVLSQQSTENTTHSTGNNTQVLDKEELKLVFQELRSQFFEEDMTFINTLITNKLRKFIRKTGHCKKLGAFHYYDYEIDRCEQCKGVCAQEDVTCWANCHDFSLYQNITSLIWNTNQQMQRKVSINQDQQEITDTRTFVLLGLWIVLMLIVCGLGIIGFVKYKELHKQIQRKTTRPSGDRVNLVHQEETTQR